jgi:RNA 3'-terminal phosphate cyclase (ATP)
MLNIDGSIGEGGGQILRTSLALALVTGTPVRIENIRANRSKPGLLRQHLAAAKAIQEIGAEVDGAELGSRELVVRPGSVAGGDYTFSVGSAGSACLVLQSVLPPLLASGQAAHLTLEGGTHNPFAPPFDFLQRVFAPILSRMGPAVSMKIARRGFYPAGGGRFDVELPAAAPLQPIELIERGERVARCSRAIVAHLSGEIAVRELDVVRTKLEWSEEQTSIEQDEDSAGPGNALMLEVEFENVREICTQFGERGRKAESVARRCVNEMRRYLAHSAPVGEHLADQLMIPFAMAGAGAFRTLPLTQHSRTNLDVIRQFLPVKIDVRETETDVLIEFSSSR